MARFDEETATMLQLKNSEESVRLWGVIFHKGLFDINQISKRMESMVYQAMFYDHLIPFGGLMLTGCLSKKNDSCYVYKSNNE